MTLERQVEIIEGQLECFEDLLDKLKYLNMFFKPDPDFSQQAIQIVIGNISSNLKNS